MAQGTTKGVPIDTDPLLAADNDLLVPSQKAIKTYVDNSNTNQVTGVGVSNQITYFTAASTIGSLTTATYPSLTELSYVKGITSAIQTQLDNKQASLGFTPVTNARTLTINGTAYDLSADRSWTVTGTVPKVYITSNSTTNSLSITDITGMSFSVSANKTYTVWGVFYVANSGSGGVKFGVNCPTSTTIKFTATGLASTSAYSTQVVTNNNALGGGTFAASNASLSAVWVICSFITTNSGTIQFRFASSVATTNTSTIYADSWIHYTES